MGYDIQAVKRPVNMTINEDLIRQARELIPNLSVAVEALLAEHVQALQESRSSREKQIADVVAAHNAFYEKYGNFADDHTDF